MAYEFRLPDLGEGLTEGEVARWLVQEGQEVAEDDPLVEIQTDKTTVEVPSPAAGTITSILVAEGQVSKQIADNLGLAVRTIETYRARVMRRLAIHSVAGLTRYAIAQGLIPLEAGREQYAAPEVSLE